MASYRASLNLRFVGKKNMIQLERVVIYTYPRQTLILHIKML